MGQKGMARALAADPIRTLNPNLPLITETTEEITPAVAMEMLKKNLRNRPINWRRVEEIAEVMKRGEWRLTPQGIILSASGNILTGQHRLQAVVKSGVTVYMRVSRGNPEDIGKLLDRGAPQTARDLAARDTERKHSPTEQSIARALAYLTGNPRPSTDDIAAIMATYSTVVAAMLKEVGRTQKGKAHLMIMAAIAQCVMASRVADPDVAAALRVLEIGKLVAELEKALAPESADKCWNKGAAFTLAMKRAAEVVA